MKTNVVIIVVAMIFAGAVGYFAYDYGRAAGKAEGLASAQAFFADQQRFPGGTNGNRQGAQVPQGGAPNNNNNPVAALFGGVQGTVDKVDGNTLTVTVTRGQQTQQVKVNLNDKTTVETFAQGSANDIKVGARILVGVERQQAQDQATPGATPSTAQRGQVQIPSEVNARTITVLPTTFGQ